jgi:hypothetical protein
VRYSADRETVNTNHTGRELKPENHRPPSFEAN